MIGQQIAGWFQSIEVSGGGGVPTYTTEQGRINGYAGTFDITVPDGVDKVVLMFGLRDTHSPDGGLGGLDGAGGAFSQILAVTANGGVCYTDTWRRDSPTAGTQTIEVTRGNWWVGAYVAWIAYYITGCQDGAPNVVTSATGGENPFTVPITTDAADSLVIGCVVNAQSGLTTSVGTDQTNDEDTGNVANASLSSISRPVATAGSTSVTWTQSPGGDRKASVVMAIAPSS